jgi:DNA polymerase I-like protein with 3'-5' exonuclease and polymerase domains
MGENTMRHRLAKILKEPKLKIKRVRDLIKSIVDAYPIAEKWRQDQMSGDSRKTETRTLGGRLVRNVTEDPQRLNYPIQGSAADVMKEIAVTVVEKIVGVYSDVELCALIHDEVVLLAPENVADEVANTLNGLMKSVAYNYLNKGVEDPALCVVVGADTNVVVNLKEVKG